MNTIDIVHIIGDLNWMPFDSENFETYGNVTTSRPMIAYDVSSIYVLDGEVLTVYYTYDFEGEVYIGSKAFIIKAQEV